MNPVNWFNFLKPRKKFIIFESLEDAIRSVPDKKAVLTEVNGEFICITRNGQEFKAFQNRCPHNEMPLNKGFINDKDEWVCPYHRHCFNLQNGKNLTMESKEKLTLYRLETKENGVFLIL